MKTKNFTSKTVAFLCIMSLSLACFCYGVFAADGESQWDDWEVNTLIGDDVWSEDADGVFSTLGITGTTLSRLQTKSTYNLKEITFKFRYNGALEGAPDMNMGIGIEKAVHDADLDFYMCRLRGSNLENVDIAAWVPAEVSVAPGSSTINVNDGEYHTVKITFSLTNLIFALDGVEIANFARAEGFGDGSDGGRFNNVKVWIQSYNTAFDIKEFVIMESDASETQHKFGFAPVVDDTTTPAPSTPDQTDPTDSTPPTVIVPPTGDNGNVFIVIGGLILGASVLFIALRRRKVQQ